MGFQEWRFHLYRFVSPGPLIFSESGTIIALDILNKEHGSMTEPTAAPAEYRTLLYDVEDGILTLTLNRPEKLNAFTTSMKEDLIDAINQADEDDDVRVIIVTGAGRGFCAGADLSSGSNNDLNLPDRPDPGPQSELARDGGGMVTLRFFDCKKPMIAAVNGPAVGIGVTMQLAMDIRLASTKARFGFVFARRGLVMEACSSWFLPKVVGLQQACEWVLTGRVFDAQEALDGGLIRSIHEPEDLLPAARALAREIADNNSAVSVSMCRQMLWKMSAADHPMEAHKIDTRGIRAMRGGGDSKEGIAAFLEKRPAVFPLRVSQDMPDFYPWWTERVFD
jgi:enoyl-CoA hydratase/carnithine racemase